MPYLSIRHLTKAYDGNTVLRNIHLEVEKGMFLSLLGPSGCGKTTILRILAGLTEADSGTIELDGRVINGLPAHKRNMGIVFQSYALFPHMTVAQNVAYGLEQRKMDKKEIRRKVADAIDMVQLTGYENRKPKQLSGGQQQRVALARALVIEPDLLLLDESLSALDKQLRLNMQVELRQIQKKVGITTIFVTHDQEEAMTMSDKIAVMKDGGIVQVDTPENVYERPVNKFVASFLGQANFIKGTVVEQQGERYTLKMDGDQTMQFETAQKNLQLGESCTVTVRPEKIRLSPDATEKGLKGTVKFITYAGNTTIYRIDVGGHEFIVQQQNMSGTASFRTGDHVYLHWDKIHTLVFKDE